MGGAGTVEFIKKENYTIEDLLAIVEILRAPGGCPWDREQTHHSIRKNLIEESYEVVDAIDQEDDALLREELGDVLLQIVLHTQMEQEQGNFSFDDVCNEICQKLVYRHPHVFGEVQANDTAQVLENWEALKNLEKGRETVADRLDSVPISFPALMRAEKLQKRADAFGFGYESPNAALQDLRSETVELEQAMQENENIVGEIGDVLFSAANVARILGVDAEEALTQTSNRFAQRVKMVEQMSTSQGKTLESLTDEERSTFWQQAKAQIAKEEQ